MRTYSTPQSALNGAITKLAIVECVASAALYIGIGIYLGTFKYLALAVVSAPLMLFRTEFSADWGYRYYTKLATRWEEFGGHNDSVRDAFVSFAWIILTPVVGTAIRVFATVYWTFRRPLRTLRNMPQNWVRQCFCTDFAHPPEIVSKESLASVEDRGHIIIFDDVIELIRNEKPIWWYPIIFLLSPIIILGWIPSLIYRVSFKATALAYVPFIWVAHATLQNPLPVKARLERFTKGELEKVRRGVSYIVLTTLVAKSALVFNWIDRGKIEAMFPSQKIVTDIVVLNGWPWWQITFGADALLTFALLYFADAALPRLEAQRPWREESVMTTVATISFLRASFGVVTIAHFFHIALLATAPEWTRPLLTF